MTRISMTGCVATPDQAAALMKPYAGEIEAWRVGAEAGNAKNNRPELMERVGLLWSARERGRRYAGILTRAALHTETAQLHKMPKSQLGLTLP